MSSDLAKLKDELARLERELESSHFQGLFETRAHDQKLRKLKKLRKQIAALDPAGATATSIEAPAARKKPTAKPAVASRKPVAARKPAAAKKPAGKPTAKAPAGKKRAK